MSSSSIFPSSSFICASLALSTSRVKDARPERDTKALESKLQLSTLLKNTALQRKILLQACKPFIVRTSGVLNFAITHKRRQTHEVHLKSCETNFLGLESKRMAPTAE